MYICIETCQENMQRVHLNIYHFYNFILKRKEKEMNNYNHPETGTLSI